MKLRAINGRAPTVAHSCLRTEKRNPGHGQALKLELT
jgi:hypothetical protein